MREKSIKAEAERIWRYNRKQIMDKFGEDRDKLALAEIMALRQLALSALASQTMHELTGPAKAKKFTR